jgi:hypothetical protein
MGRLHIDYLDDDCDNSEIVKCTKCRTHLLEKKDTSPILGLEISMTYKLPINIHIVPNNTLTNTSPNDYKFSDFFCNRCENLIGWTMQYPTIYGNKDLSFVLNESIS